MKSIKRINELILFSGLAKYLHGLDFDAENLNQDDTELTVVDIACDHGYIGFKILENKIADKVIFSDISAKSLEKAVILIKNSEFLQFSEFKVGDGFEILEKNVFLSIVAGVGGREIVKMLKNKNKTKISNFIILQTATDDEFLREEIKKLGYYKYVDKMMLDNGHIYHTFLIGNKEIQNIDDLSIEFFKSKNLISYDIKNINKEIYNGFNSKYFGKNNLLINTKEHIDMLKWYKGLIKSRLDVLEKTENLTDGGLSYQKTLLVKLFELDKIIQSTL